MEEWTDECDGALNIIYHHRCFICILLFCSVIMSVCNHFVLLMHCGHEQLIMLMCILLFC